MIKCYVTLWQVLGSKKGSEITRFILTYGCTQYNLLFLRLINITLSSSEHISEYYPYTTSTKLVSPDCSS